jgi:hypothetical protein
VNRVHITALLVAVAVALGVAAPPAPAQGGCGGVHRAVPEKRKRHGRLAPIAIGDSVMLGAVPNLRRAGFFVNARGCRQMREGIRVMWAHRKRGTLPRVVVLSVGTNWTVRLRDIKKAMRVAGRRRLLVLVTPREPRGGSARDARRMRLAARRWPQRVRVLDWVRRSRGKRRWFGHDGLHLTFAGRRAYTRLLARALRFPPPGERPRRRHSEHAVPA